jgi:hypothetical protein
MEVARKTGNAAKGPADKVHRRPIPGLSQKTRT